MLGGVREITRDKPFLLAGKTHLTIVLFDVIHFDSLFSHLFVFFTWLLHTLAWLTTDCPGRFLLKLLSSNIFSTLTFWSQDLTVVCHRQARLPTQVLSSCNAPLTKMWATAPCFAPAPVFGVWHRTRPNTFPNTCPISIVRAYSKRTPCTRHRVEAKRLFIGKGRKA